MLEHWGRTGCGLTSSPDLDIGTDPDLGTVRGNRGCPSVINTSQFIYVLKKSRGESLIIKNIDIHDPFFSVLQETKLNRPGMKTLPEAVCSK